MRLNPGALPPPTHTLAGGAERGDRCLFLDAPLSTPPQTLWITGGPVDEFQAFVALSVRTDAEGYFRFPPLQRMARIALTVDDGLGNVLPRSRSIPITARRSSGSMRVPRMTALVERNGG